MEKTQLYKEFELRWDDPPQTGVGWEVSLVGSTPELQEKLEGAVSAHGSHPMPPRKSFEDAITRAQAFIEDLLAK